MASLVTKFKMLMVRETGGIKANHAWSLVTIVPMLAVAEVSCHTASQLVAACMWRGEGSVVWNTAVVKRFGIPSDVFVLLL